MPDKRKTYLVKLRCGNCDHKWALDFPRGQTADQETGISANFAQVELDGEPIECPNCGCNDRVHIRRYNA